MGLSKITDAKFRACVSVSGGLRMRTLQLETLVLDGGELLAQVGTQQLRLLQFALQYHLRAGSKCVKKRYNGPFFTPSGKEHETVKRQISKHNTG